MERNTNMTRLEGIYVMMELVDFDIEVSMVKGLTKEEAKWLLKQIEEHYGFTSHQYIGFQLVLTEAGIQQEHTHGFLNRMQLTINKVKGRN